MTKQSLCLLRVLYIVVRPVRLSSSSLVILCCHLILRIHIATRDKLFRQTFVGEERLHVQKLCQQYQAGKFTCGYCNPTWHLVFLYKLIILASRMCCGTLVSLQHLTKIPCRRGNRHDLHWRYKSTGLLSLPCAFHFSYSFTVFFGSWLAIKVIHRRFLMCLSAASVTIFRLE